MTTDVPPDEAHLAAQRAYEHLLAALVVETTKIASAVHTHENCIDRDGDGDPRAAQDLAAALAQLRAIRMQFEEQAMPPDSLQSIHAQADAALCLQSQGLAGMCHAINTRSRPLLRAAHKTYFRGLAQVAQATDALYVHRLGAQRRKRWT